MSPTITYAIALLFLSLAIASPLHEHGKRTQIYGTILYSCVGANKVALTFDDGPYIYTSAILDKLKAANMRATFFINGNNYDSIYNYNSTVRRYIADGHQIGSHTWSHKDLSTLNSADITLEMTKLEDALKAILGYFPFYMRAPYLGYSSLALSTLGILKYVVVDSDINPQDWKYNTPATVSTANSQFLTGLNAGGGLTELHDVQATTNSDVVPYIINLLQSRGLTSVPVGECFGEPASNWYRTSRDGSSPPPVSSSTSTSVSVNSPSGTTISSVVPTTSSIITTTSSIVTTTSSGVTTPTGVISPDSTCGGTKGYLCTPGKCCSKSNWCGATAAYCGTGCQPAFGLCGIIPPGATSPDGSCGAANGYVCPGTQCCSTYGHCGTGTAYCAASSGCQAGYGAACT